MATMKMPCAVGSGGESFFKPAEVVSTTRIKGSWNFNAKCVLISVKNSSTNKRYWVLFDLVSGNKFVNTGDDLYMTDFITSQLAWTVHDFSPTSFDITMGTTPLANSCYVPCAEYPTGFFS